MTAPSVTTIARRARTSIHQAAAPLLQPGCAPGLMRRGRRNPAELKMGPVQYPVTRRWPCRSAWLQAHDEIGHHGRRVPLVRRDPRVQMSELGLEQGLPDI